jgi:hypothetical protein
VPLEKRSPAVAEHYDRELAAKGWQKRAPKAGQPGQRQWIAIAVQAGGGAATSGPTDAYDAAWEDPKTGRVAVLNLWHAAKDPSVQHGTFDIYEKGQAPF